MTTQNKVEVVVSAVDKATATLNQINARLERAVAPAQAVSRAFGNLFKATGFGAVSGAIGSLTHSLGGLATASATAAAATAGAVAALGRFALGSVDAADKIGDLSARYNIASKDLQVYGAAMEEAGVGTVEDAAASLGKLQKAMSEAIHGGKEQAEAFAGVGISVAELKKMKPDQVVARMAEAFKNAGDGKDLEKNAVLLQLMGRSGSAWMSIMNEGGDKLKARYAEMIADGRIYSEEQLKQADQFDKSWQRMTGTLEGLKNALGIKLAGALEDTVKKFQEWIVTNRELIETKFAEFLKELPDIIREVRDFMRGLWDVMKGVVVVFKALSSILGPTLTVFLGVAAVLAPVILSAGQLFFALGKVVWIIGQATGLIPFLMAKLTALWALMLANPIVLIIAAVVALAVIIYKNWDSIVAYVESAWERIKGVFDAGFFSGMIQLWLEQWQALANGILGIIKSIPVIGDLPAVKDAKFTFATDRAARIAAEQQDARRQEIKNQVSIKIDAEGRPRVTEMKSGSPQTEMDVSTGLAMAGA